METTERVTHGGLVILSTCLAKHPIEDDDGVWSVWRDSFNGGTLRTWIQLELRRDGRTFKWIEGEGLTRVDCPVSFFEIATTVADRNWRDRVWQWNEKQLALGVVDVENPADYLSEAAGT